MSNTNMKKDLNKDLGLFRDAVELRNKRKITLNQLKGILLEIATFYALVELGIQPIPLHNPFDEEYPKDSHLSVDIVFIHNGLLYGVECKNLSMKETWSRYNDREWVEKEVLKRFGNLEKEYHVDRKLLIVSHYVESMKRYIPADYKIVEVGCQTITQYVHESTQILLNNLKTLFFSQNKQYTNLDKVHGYIHNYKRLKYVQDKLRREY